MLEKIPSVSNQPRAEVQQRHGASLHAPLKHPGHVSPTLGDRTTLQQGVASHNLLIGRVRGQGSESEIPAAQTTDVEKNDKARLKRVAKVFAGAVLATLAAYVAFIGVIMWISYALGKHAVKNGIKEAAADGAFVNQNPRQPVVVISGRNTAQPTN